MITKYGYLKLKERYKNGFRWIARDKDGCLYIYYSEPKRLVYSWDTERGCSEWSVNDDLLQCIKWEDEKPTKILDLIRDYESHQIITGGNNLNKSELIKEIEEILDDIGVSDYQLGEYEEDTIWAISSITIRKIFSAIEKHSLDGVKATVPQFVADWIEDIKPDNSLRVAFEYITQRKVDNHDDPLSFWVEEGNSENFARAWLDGYEIEKEKLYTVQLKNGYHLCKYEGAGVRWLNMTEFNKADCYKLTKAEIESVDPRLMQFAEEVE